MEAFPNNPNKSGKIAMLGEHYQRTLNELGHKDTKLPESLFFTFCGDILGSSGEHYEKGSSITFFEATERASLSFSDDYMESLAMFLMKDADIPLECNGLIKAKKDFFDLIADHFEALAQTYSPWFSAIRDANSQDNYLDVVMNHGSCGAAMRAAVLAAEHVSDEQAFKLFLLTHGHTESIEGGFWVKGYAEAAIEGQSFEECVKNAAEKSDLGRKLILDFQKTAGRKPEPHTALNHFVSKVLEQDDPYASIDNIVEEGIETRFVVGAVAHVLSSLHDRGSVDKDIPSLITRSLEIGGDPDTICSIAMSLYGLRWPNESRQFLNDVDFGKLEPSA